MKNNCDILYWLEVDADYMYLTLSSFVRLFFFSLSHTHSYLQSWCEYSLASLGYSNVKNIEALFSL